MRRVVEGDTQVDWRVWNDDPAYRKARRCDFLRVVIPQYPTNGIWEIEATEVGRGLVETWDQLHTAYREGRL